MKFKTEKDQIIYEALNLNEQVIRKKLQVLKKSINRKKSRSMKDQWRRNKYKLLKGIKKWHNSTQGKRFHRALGRFNALRESGEVTYVSFEDVTDALFALSSIESHLFLELKYYESDIEALADFLEIVDMFEEESCYLKQVLLSAYVTGVILTEDLQRIKDLISFFIDPLIYYYELRNMKGLINDKNQLKNESLDKFEKEIEYIKQHLFDENIIDVIEDFVNGGQGDLGQAPNSVIGVIPSIKNKKKLNNYIDSSENEPKDNNETKDI